MTTSTSWADWVGRTDEREDRLIAAPAVALAATLDHEPPAAADGWALPALWHWLYFVPTPRASEIGPDGHARRGGFLPPVPLPRRMWAGGRLDFVQPLAIGQALRRRSVIESVDTKAGRSGEMVFVTVRHEFGPAATDTVALREWHHIVYLPVTDAAAPPAATAPARTAAWRRDLVPDDVLLFRYSALTFNAHRIHYDRRYATEVEGYPGLVVHGPLIATLLLDLLAREQPGAVPASFTFRARRPCFDGRTLTLCGAPGAEPRRVALWALDDQGALAMDAEVTLT